MPERQLSWFALVYCFWLLYAGILFWADVHLPFLHLSGFGSLCLFFIHLVLVLFCFKTESCYIVLSGSDSTKSCYSVLGAGILACPAYALFSFAGPHNFGHTKVEYIYLVPLGNLEHCSHGIRLGFVSY